MWIRRNGSAGRRLLSATVPAPVIGDLPLNEDPTGHVFQLLDPISGTYVLQGVRFQFMPIVEEVGRVLDLAYDLDAAGRLPTNP